MSLFAINPRYRDCTQETECCTSLFQTAVRVQYKVTTYRNQVVVSRFFLLIYPTLCHKLHQPRLWFITGGYLVKRWFIPAAARARGQSNDLNREILASNLFNCHKEVINVPPVPSISRCIHIVYRHKNVWEYQWSNFIYNCMSTFLHYVHCKDALLDCSAPGGERCESLTWVDEIVTSVTINVRYPYGFHNIDKVSYLTLLVIVYSSMCCGRLPN